MTSSRIVSLVMMIAAILFAVLSARLQIPQLAYGLVGVAVLSVVLCAWSRLDSQTTPYLVFALGLAFLYQSSLISNGLVGTDIHTEYYYYQAALDGWDTTIPHGYNTAIGTTVIAPFLTNWFGIPGYWVFKAVFPALFALVPVILYMIYRKEFGEKVAFLGCMFFITLPTYTLEMIGLPRQMLGEIMLAVVLLLVVVRPIRLRYSVPILIVAATLGYLFHYVMGPAILMYLAGGAVVLVFMRHRQYPLRWLAVVILVSSLLGMVYFANVASGLVLRSWTQTGSVAVERTTDVIERIITENPPDTESPPDIEGPPDTESSPDTESPPLTPPPSTHYHTQQPPARYFYTQEPLMRTALGLDFMDSSTTGKLFRIFQFGTQLALALGCWWLLRNRRKVSPEFMAFALTAAGLVAACVLLPRFSNILNLSRFYHLALFLLSPLLIMGGLHFTRNIKVLVLTLLIPYMLFTTGTVFEAVKETDISRVNIPYSIALSNHRVDLVCVPTDNDIAVMDWAKENNRRPLYADTHGFALMAERFDQFEVIHVHPEQIDVSTLDLTDGWGLLPRDVSKLPEGTYIFLSERNTQTGMLLFKPGWYNPTDTYAGIRQSYPFEFLGISDSMEVVYQLGDAVVLRTGENE